MGTSANDALEIVRIRLVGHVGFDRGLHLFVQYVFPVTRIGTGRVPFVLLDVIRASLCSAEQIATTLRTNAPTVRITQAVMRRAAKSGGGAP